jgi:hypothetical protein
LRHSSRNRWLNSFITLQKSELNDERLSNLYIEHMGTSNLVPLDLSDFIRPRGWRKGNRAAFGLKIRDRFPLYDEVWFAVERNIEVRDDDILKMLRGSWSITFFTIRMPRLGFTFGDLERLLSLAVKFLGEILQILLKPLAYGLIMNISLMFVPGFLYLSFMYCIFGNLLSAICRGISSMYG